MSYTNIEGERRNFRVIYNDHDKIASARQLPDQTTAILLEGMADTVEAAYHLMEIGGTYPAVIMDYPTSLAAKNNDKLRSVAMDKGIPLVAIEPLYMLNVFRNAMSIPLPSSAQFQSPSAFLGYIFTETVSKSRFRGHIPYASLFFYCMNEYNRHELAYDEIDLFRNLLMAEMAVAFAEGFESSTDVGDKPWYALSVGLSHTGVVTALEMSSEERLQYIRASEYFRDDLKPESRHIGVISTYNREKQQWNHSIYENPRLK